MPEDPKLRKRTTPLTPEQRHTRATIAAYARWSQEDPAANAAHGRTTSGRISLPGPVQALVVPTDEELMIARDTARLVGAER